MSDSHHTAEHAGFLARLNALETVVVAGIALVALGGLMLAGKSYMKAVVEVPALGSPVQLTVNSS